MDVHLNWLNRFHLLILLGGPLVILTVCMNFLSSALNPIRMFMLTAPLLAEINLFASKMLFFDL